ncbi:MAG: ATP-binding cassette domain-containing protein [Pseudomonadota bacterium]
MSTLIAATGPSVCLVLLSLVIGGLVDGEVLYGLLWVFLGAASLSAGALFIAIRQCGVIVETALLEKRLAIEGAISCVDLAHIERVGEAHVKEVLAVDLAKISSTARRLPPVVTSAASLVLSALVVLLFAPWILLLFFTVFAIGGAAYLVMHRRLAASIGRTRSAERSHQVLLRHLLSGRKEVRLSEDRRVAIIDDHIGPAVTAVRNASVDEITQTAGLIFVSNLFSWASLFVIVAILPLYVSDMGVVIQALYIGIFVRTYMFGLVFDLPSLLELTSALVAVEDLARALGDAPQLVSGTQSAPSDFESIRVDAAQFSYTANNEDSGFSLGPLSLDIRRGRTVFLVGANGAGKSTFLKLLTKLYEPDDGRLFVDDVPIDRANTDAYRQLFACVFTDFHLFDRLYGLKDVSDWQANALLAELGIAHRVRVTDGVFSTTDLSSGQRQRLALAVALLEDRPILVLDEIAADQDPNFRRRIYRELIPKWRDEGRTLIVVSHDDRFFDLADTLVTFDSGEVTVEHRERSQS